MRIELDRGVAPLLAQAHETSLTVDLILRFCGGLAVKDAYAFPGSSPAAAGFRREVVDGIDVWWRQRLLVEGRWEAAVTDQVAPRRVVIKPDGDTLTAAASYA